MKPTLIEFDEYITPDGETYKFRNGIQKFVLSGTNGLGLPKIKYRTQRGPFQDGQTVLGFTIEPRILTLVHRRNGCSRQQYWDIRADILNMVRPNRQALNSFDTGTLRKILPDGSKRDLSVFINKGLQFDDDPGKWDEFSIQDAVQFIAHDPIVFDPDSDSQTFAYGASLNELIFPITFGGDDIIFDNSGILSTNNITYEGTYKAFPTITILGPILNPSIKNNTLEVELSLETTVAAGETVTIDLEFGNKTITNDSGDNLIGDLTSDSDLADFRLEPAPTAPSGVNEIFVSGFNVDGNTLITMTWNTRYIGI